MNRIAEDHGVDVILPIEQFPDIEEHRLEGFDNLDAAAAVESNLAWSLASHDPGFDDPAGWVFGLVQPSGPEECRILERQLHPAGLAASTHGLRATKRNTAANPGVAFLAITTSRGAWLFAVGNSNSSHPPPCRLTPRIGTNAVKHVRCWSERRRSATR